MIKQPERSTRKAKASFTPEILASYNMMLLDLHSDARIPVREDFQARAFARLKTLVDYDYGWWVLAFMDLNPEVDFTGPEVFDAHFAGLPATATPDSVMKNYIESLKNIDLVAKASGEAPGITINACIRDWYPETLWPYFDSVRIRHQLATTFDNPVTGLQTGFAINRKNQDHPFSEQEQLLVQNLVPHLVDTLSQVKLAPWLEDTVTELKFPCAGIVDHQGVIRHAGGGFAEMLQSEWPGWRGPHIPEPLKQLVAKDENGQLTCGEIIASVHQGYNLALIRMRSRRLADQLSQQQLKVARYTTDGMSFKEIAQVMDLAPSTVRSYTSIIYRKLEVNNKIQLAEVLHDVD